MEKKDPYAALRFPEFRLFLLMRFALVFAWSMQFVVIEWQIYSLTKDPLSLGIIGLMEVIPAVGLALFAGHIADQREKRNLLLKCILAFMCISVGLFALTWPPLTAAVSASNVAMTIYGLVFFGGIIRAFFGPTIFSLFGLVVPRHVYPNAAGLEQFYMANWGSIGPRSWWHFNFVAGYSLVYAGDSGICAILIFHFAAY
jgi:MFS family permease